MLFWAICLLNASLDAAAAQDKDKGYQIAKTHCSRCHVVAPENRHAGISSTPSFMMMVEALPDWRERFETFYARRPHPVHVRISGLPVPDPNSQPPNATPFDLTLSDVADLLAYAETLQKAP